MNTFPNILLQDFVNVAISCTRQINQWSRIFELASGCSSVVFVVSCLSKPTWGYVTRSIQNQSHWSKQYDAGENVPKIETESVKKRVSLLVLHSLSAYRSNSQVSIHIHVSYYFAI